MVVSLTNAVNHPIKLTEPSVVVVNRRSMGSGGDFHYVCTPFELLQHAPLPWLPLVTSDDLKDIRPVFPIWTKSLQRRNNPRCSHFMTEHRSCQLPPNILNAT